MERLQVDHLNVTFHDISGELTAVHDLSFSLKQGEILGIIGESGCGKSAMAKAIMGLHNTPGKSSCRGQIFLEGKDLSRMKRKDLCKIRGKDITMIFQEPMTALNPVMTVYDQINEVFKLHKIGNQTENYKTIIETLSMLGIRKPREIIKKYPFELSGGLRQRIVIAMAVVAKPKLIIADEPSTALDVTTQSEILGLLKKIVLETGCSILLITHDLGVIAEIADRVMVMYQGMEMEICRALEWFDYPVHPYSKGLIASRPSNFDGRFYAIEGNVKLNYGRITGCPFYERCHIHQDRCFKETPPSKEISSGHRVSCFFSGEGREHE